MTGISSFLTAGRLASLTIRNPVSAREERESSLSTASPLVKLAAVLEETVGGGDLVEQARDADRIITQLESTKDSAKEARKARAKEKLEQIKAQMRMLQLLALDPEALARKIKQLSRMLAAAVREYASAGGTDASASAPTPATIAGPSPSPTADSPPTAMSATAQTGAVAAAVEETVSSNAPASAPDTTQENAAPSQNDDTTTDVPGTAAETEEPHGHVAVVANGKAGDNGDRDKQDFLRDVRFIKSMLKSLIEQARRKMDTDPGAENDLKESEKALKKVETLLNDIAADTISPTPSLNVIA